MSVEGGVVKLGVSLGLCMCVFYLQWSRTAVVTLTTHPRTHPGAEVPPIEAEQLLR